MHRCRPTPKDQQISGHRNEEPPKDAERQELSFVLGIATVQLGGAGRHMLRLLFARFFTVHATLLVAGPIVALLAGTHWGRPRSRVPLAGLATQAVPLLATVCYRITLAARVPLEARSHDRPERGTMTVCDALGSP